MSRNDEIRTVLKELAELTVLDEQSPNSFRARAYDKALQSLETVSVELADMSLAELKALPGIGESIAHKIREHVDTGRIDKLEELRAKYPREILLISRIPGVGPKTLERLRNELGIQSLADLVAAIDAQRVRALPGLGAKTEEKIKAGIDRLGFKTEQRTPIAVAMAEAMRFAERLSAHPKVTGVVPCGSLRRQRETVGDIDLVVGTESAEEVAEWILALPGIQRVIGSGLAKTSVIGASGLQVDLRYVRPEDYGAAILYFTGSKAHNIRLRQLAMERGWTLNEYALTEESTGARVASRTEEEIYRALSLPFIPPPMREDTGEIEAGLAGTLTNPLSEGSLQGDLHVHTTASSEGRSPLAEVVAAAAGRGYRYLAIADRSLTREALARQREEIDALRPRYPDLLLLHGCEIDISPDGSLDPDLRPEGGWCIAALHGPFDLPPSKQTDRLIRAVSDPSVRMIARLTGRLIGGQAGAEFDVDAVIDAIVKNDVAIEINSALSRLDPPAPLLRRAAQRGALFAVSSDAYHVSELAQIRFGVYQGQRGWVEPDRVVNAWPHERLSRWLGQVIQR